MVSANICHHFSHILRGLGVRGPRKLGLIERNVSTIAYSHLTCCQQDALGKLLLYSSFNPGAALRVSGVDTFTQITCETQVHYSGPWHLMLPLTQKQHAKDSGASGEYSRPFGDENKTQWTAGVIEGRMERCSHSAPKHKFFLFLLAVKHEPCLLSWSDPMRNLCYLSQFSTFETDVIGKGIRECSGCQICFLSGLHENSFLRPIWSMNGGGEPRINCFGRRSAMDWSLCNTGKERFKHQNHLAWKDSELWAHAPGGWNGRGLENISLQELVL